MATLALSVAGQFAGGLIGGPVGATIGRALGALAGSAIDGMLFGDKRSSEAPMFDVRLGSSTEGAPIPRLYGWGRLSGNIVWARELLRHVTETAGSKGLGRPEPEREEEVLASFAVAFCEGPVARLGRIWADGQLLDTRGLTLRFYDGREDQLPDSLIEAVQGSGNAPAYRGLCYLVVENLPLSRFGNRIPHLSAELCRVVGDLEPSIRAITVIPGATEFGYDPVARVRLVRPGEGVSENSHLLAGVSDWTCSIDELVALCSNLEHVALVVSWFGDDLRCGHCQVLPRVEGTSRNVEGTSWRVAGFGRGDVPVVSSHGGGPAYGGTPSDASVRAAIADLKSRGLKVTLYPLMLMDIAGDNGLPDPYGGARQAAYPWRGRITCHPAAGEAGSPDGSASAAAQIAAFVPSYRAMVLHYAGLAEEAGGVDTILIGSEMRGLTTVRGTGQSYPFVEALRSLASDVRSVVGSGTRISYAADWSEYSGHQIGGGKVFHLDPLWASQHIDAIGIDCYMPLADWRDGTGHADAEQVATGYELDYLEGNIEGGEGFDWFYASDADRRAQVRTPITDGAHGEPWVWRFKDLRNFWSQRHYDRPNGVRSETPTAWVPGSKPIWLTELGCGAVDKGANQPNIFGDDKSAEGGRPYFSSGQPDALMQRQFLRAHHRYWRRADNNPPGMLDVDRIYCWTWDARPYPSFPALEDVWSDGANHRTGHWLTGRLGMLASDELAGAIARDHGCTIEAAAAGSLIGGMVVNGPGTARDAIEPVLEISGQSLVARNGDLVGIVAGGGNSVVLVRDDLAEEEGPILSRRRGDALEKPVRISLGHFDRERDYLAANATASRPGQGPLISEALPMVLDGTGARQAAERMLDRRAAASDRIELALPPGQVDLEPGDRIALPNLAEGPFEITEIRDGAVRRITAMATERGASMATGVERPRPGPSVPPPPVAPVIIAAHLPPLADDPMRSRIVFGAYARPWPGHVRVTDEGSGALLAELVRPLVLGETAAPLSLGPTALWDDANALEIALGSGHLADIAETAALGGGNRLAVQSDSGVWEVIGFAKAELVSPGRYRLTRLLRGLEGTPVGSASAGRPVMLLDGRAVSIPFDAGRIGESRTLRCYAGPIDASGVSIVIAPAAGPALPLAPVHVRAKRREDGSIGFGWIRRSRADGDGWGMAEPALDHAPEAWRIDILQGDQTVRTILSGSNAAFYDSAAQAADFGGPASDFGYAVSQISPVLGPGHRAEGMFHV